MDHDAYNLAGKNISTGSLLGKEVVILKLKKYAIAAK